jgi:DNA-directed RNA polymerase beta' subunit
MKPAIKIDAQDIKAHGYTYADFVPVEALGGYGFDEEIVNKMLRYEIFPQVFVLAGQPQVLRASIFEVVNGLLLNSMRLYELVDETDKAKKDMVELLEKSGVEITREDLARIEAQEIGLLELATAKKAQAIHD